MSKTLLDIPDDLMAEAQAVMGPGATKIATVKAALELLIQRKRQQDALDWIASAPENPFLTEAEVAEETGGHDAP